jgi:uncharacterized protein
MRNSHNVFHLAIPCDSLIRSVEFYVEKLGARLARKYDDRITLDFFGDQVVCHYNPEKIDRHPEIYPRHFGITFKERKDFDAIINRLEKTDLEYFKKPFVRFEGMDEEHHTFFLIDPSNNIIEFKYYKDTNMMY